MEFDYIENIIEYWIVFTANKSNRISLNQGLNEIKLDKSTMVSQPIDWDQLVVCSGSIVLILFDN